MNRMNRQSNPPTGRRRQGDSRSSPSPASAGAINVTFYRDAQRTQLNPTLLDEDAKKQAMAFPEKGKKLTKSQIRRFFGTIKRLDFQFRRGRSWEQIEPLFRMIRSKAFYARHRDTIPPAFFEFITTNIDKVKTPKDFEAFVQYFEAVLGFAYGLDRVGDK